MTVRLNCPGSCRVTVLEVPADRRLSALGYFGRAFAPAGGGTYRVEIDELVTRSGGYVKEGCEALRVRAVGDLSRVGKSVTITTRHPKHEYAGGNGLCLLLDRESIFTGTLS